MGSKVQAQAEADRKLFTAVTIEAPEALDDAVRVLTLLSRDNMRARAIDELWQAWHVDRQVQAALEQTFQDDAFAALIGSACRNSASPISANRYAGPALP
ncbi:hypothetical protein ACFQU2_13860 [Siccirubricoccus deserti]